MNEHQKKYEMLVYFRQHICKLSHKKTITKRHHIKMVSLWPKYANDPTNIVVFKIAEHILAHKYLMNWYLAKYGENDNRYIAAFKAYWYMIISRDDVQLFIEEASNLRAEAARLQSIKTKGKPLSEKNRLAIIEAWQDEQLCKEQSIRIRATFAAHPEFGQKIPASNFKRYEDPKAHEKSSIAGKRYFAKHPEAAIKHGNDIKDRILIYDVSTNAIKRITGNMLQQYLDNSWTLGIPIFKLITRGKNKGKLFVKFICPWTISDSCYFKPNTYGKQSKWQLDYPKHSDITISQIVTKEQLNEYNDLVNKIINNY